MTTERRTPPRAPCPSCGRPVLGRASRIYCSSRCRWRAWKARADQHPPLVVRDVETIPAAEFEAALIEAFRRRQAFGWALGDLKAILIRAANRLGTDQRRGADGRFR